MHIAYADVSRCDYVISWNMKHIVRPKTISGVNNVNFHNNFNQINIATPQLFTGEFHMQTTDLPTDSVEMVRAIRQRHYEETKEMSREERREYYRKTTEKFISQWKQLIPMRTSSLFYIKISSFSK
ncbi:MAG: hypothetical protein LBQ50_05960 [Planctomycetaceae bacterium]|nr:hypothetical protein [Planctomycetaceae bacterium]